MFILSVAINAKHVLGINTRRLRYGKGCFVILSNEQQRRSKTTT